MYIGCDTGGTFTDFVMYVPGRGVVTLKLSSTPHDPSEAVLEGISRLCDGVSPAHVNHATTVATNALLEKTGGKVAFVTTEGFGDLLQLARGQRSELYSLAPSRVTPPVEKHLCFEVKERVLASGEVRIPLAELEFELPSDLDAVAVCLLHSSLNPRHESALGEKLRCPRVFLSHQVAPGSGEYERGMTTLITAYLSPRVERYLQKIEEALGEESLLRIVHSAGGLLTVEEARAFPHRMALSGPAAGLRGAQAVGLECSQPNLVTLDMGGTSTDVALLADGKLPYSWQTVLEGYPLRAPTLEIHTIGAGGGSIATADPNGLLQVGPRSAGAAPGPVCYARGGDRPTVTDALCWNGFLPSTLGDEKLRLDREAAGRALAELGASLSLNTEQTSEGILELAASHLAEAVRKVTTGQGRDPAGFTLFPFGGAGPLLACRVADNLAMNAILVPACAGVLSAWGALTAPWEREWSMTVPPGARTDLQNCQDMMQSLRRRAKTEFSDLSGIEWTELVARRYRGQGDALVSSPGTDFHRLHSERFGFHRGGLEVETVEVRLRARRAPLERALSQVVSEEVRRLEPARLRWADEVLEVPVYRCAGVPGNLLEGPALLLQGGSTVFVAPGWKAETSEGSHILMRRTT